MWTNISPGPPLRWHNSSWVITFMMIHVYLPHSDRQVDWIGRSRPFKNCWGFGINTFLVISFKSWVTGLPQATSMRPFEPRKIILVQNILKFFSWWMYTRLWRSGNRKIISLMGGKFTRTWYVRQTTRNKMIPWLFEKRGVWFLTWL